MSSWIPELENQPELTEEEREARDKLREEMLVELEKESDAN